MARNLLIAISVLWTLTGFYIFFAPQHFYDNTPGLSMMGPFSMHFIRDVALVFFASGCTTMWGALQRMRPVALAGVLWPALHAAFHVQLWAARGFVLDDVSRSDLVAVILPATVAVITAAQISESSNSAATSSDST